MSQAGDPRSTDYYFQAAVFSWQSIHEHSDNNELELSDWSTYQTSLAGLITEASRFGRLNRGTLRIYQPEGPQDITLVSTGLPWPVDQLTDLQIGSSSKDRNLEHYYATPGVGVPVVAIRTRPIDAGQALEEQFYPARLPVAATVLLRSRHGHETNDLSEPQPEFVLDLANPLQVGSIEIGKQQLPIARDISAPLEYLLENRPSNPWTGFILPGSETRDDDLNWLEPYQPGKIPIVFVHGLLSDTSTWMDMLNYLRTQDWFNENYQAWGFSYSTGSPFVASALRLRHQLRHALSVIDPHSQDPALAQMVLVGHSMGGLVAKLQVAESDDRLWNSISRVPLQSIQGSREVKQQLAERLYFTPQPFVKRVVYIATPHSGSSLAVRGIGRLSSALVRPDENNRSMHRQLINDNPDAFFGTFRKRIPTSIDLLEPNDPTLQAIHDLYVPSQIVQHTILGTGKMPWSMGWSDGVVKLDSARHPETISEFHVAAAHTEITRDDATIIEVARIMQLHLKKTVEQCGQFVPRVSPTP